jgi:hypothetical protein
MAVSHDRPFFGRVVVVRRRRVFLPPGVVAYYFHENGLKCQGNSNALNKTWDEIGNLSSPAGTMPGDLKNSQCGHFYTTGIRKHNLTNEKIITSYHQRFSKRTYYETHLLVEIAFFTQWTMQPAILSS